MKGKKVTGEKPCLGDRIAGDQLIVTERPVQLLLSANVCIFLEFFGPVRLNGLTVVALLGFVWLAEVTAIWLAAILVRGLVGPLQGRFNIGGPGRLVVAATHGKK